MEEALHRVLRIISNTLDQPTVINPQANARNMCRALQEIEHVVKNALNPINRPQ